MTNPNMQPSAHAEDNFARILETCRAAREAQCSHAETPVESLLKSLSPSQMLAVAASAQQDVADVDSAAFLAALCNARLFDASQNRKSAPEYNAHLALAA